MQVQTQNNWQRLFENTSDAIFIIHADTSKILDANEPALQLSSYSLPFLKKSCFSDFLISDTPVEWSEFLKMTQMGIVNRQESKILTKSHNLINIRIKAVPLVDNSFENALMLLIRKEETKNQQEDKLQQKLKFYETILMQMPTEFAVLNSQWQYLFVNQNSIKDKDFREWMIGKTDYDFCRYRNKPFTLAENRHRQYEELARTKTGKEWIDEHDLPDGGKKFVLRKLFPYFENGELSLNFGFGIDITEMVAAERRQEETMRKISLQNEDLMQFAYITTHDLKEPLRNISSFTNLLQRRYGKQFSSEAKEFMEFIIGNAKRMNGLLEALKSYVTIENNVFEKVEIDFKEIVEMATSNLQWLIHEKGAMVTMENLPKIAGHRMYLVQLFQNLINNSIKFCEKTPEIHIKAYEKEEYFRFEISDNGIGILPEYQTQIFKIFNRLDKQNYEGTGMGLSICKKTVELHDGRIWVESDGENGSTFFFDLKKQ